MEQGKLLRRNKIERCNKYEAKKCLNGFKLH